MSSERAFHWPVSLAVLLALVALATAIAALRMGDREPLSVGPQNTAVRPSQDEAKGLREPAAPGPAGATQPDVPNRKSTIRLSPVQAPATKEELEAEATFVATQLIAALPEEPKALHVRAMLHAQLHETEEAERLWKECIEKEPETEQYYVNLAAIALDRGNSELAVETLQNARKAGLDSPDISHHLGVSLINVGREDEAAKLAEAALESYPNSAALRLIHGQALLKMGEAAEAEVSLRQAIELGAKTKAAYFALFNTCMRLGKKEQAAELRDIYLQFDQEESVAAQDRYQLLSDAEARRVAISVLSEAASLYASADLLKAAEHGFLRVLALDPQNKSACVSLAEIYGRQQRAAEELVCRERIVELDPLNLMNYLLLARGAADMGDVETAEASIKLAISLAPQAVTGYAAMADFLLEQNQPAKAQWYVEQAIALRPSEPGYQLLARTLRAQGKESLAQAAEEAMGNLNKSPN